MADLVRRTTGCAPQEHPEFTLRYNDDLVTPDDLDFLVDRLESAVAAGERYQEGSVLRVGWVAMRMRQDDGMLVLQEPDMVHTPMWWIDSVNHTLLHRRLQRGVCLSVFDEDRAVFPSSMDEAWLCDDLGETEDFVMRRVEPVDGLSGWIFTCDRSDHDHSYPSSLRRMALYDVAIGYEPRAIPYLALPVGVTVELCRTGPRIRVDDEPVVFRSDSLLDHHFGGSV